MTKLINDTVEITGATDLDSTLNVDGASTLQSTLDVMDLVNTYNNVNMYKEAARSTLNILTYRGSANGSIIQFLSSRGTIASPVVSANNDLLGQIVAYGYSPLAANFIQAAHIAMLVDGTPNATATDMPGRIEFYTSPDGSATPLKRTSISSAGLLAHLYDMTVSGTLGVTGLVTASAGVNFGGSTLANYVEGTWTPVLRFGGATTGITYSGQTGLYTRIGNLVYAYGSIILTNKGSATGTATIAGLPLTANASGFPTWCLYSGMGASYVQVMAQVGASSTLVNLYGITAAAAANNSVLTNTSFGNSSLLQFGATYMV